MCLFDNEIFMEKNLEKWNNIENGEISKKEMEVYESIQDSKNKLGELKNKTENISAEDLIISDLNEEEIINTEIENMVKEQKEQEEEISYFDEIIGGWAKIAEKYSSMEMPPKKKAEDEIGNEKDEDDDWLEKNYPDFYVNEYFGELDDDWLKQDNQENIKNKETDTKDAKSENKMSAEDFIVNELQEETRRKEELDEMAREMEEEKLDSENELENGSGKERMSRKEMFEEIRKINKDLEELKDITNNEVLMELRNIRDQLEELKDIVDQKESVE